MSEIGKHIAAIREQLPPSVTLLCVSKFHPVSMIEEAYACGERHFGESRAQELVQKHAVLPKDIHWHFIGHLQTNKVSMVVPVVSLIESVDSQKLLMALEKEASRIGRTVDVLLEVHVASEETKSGFAPSELAQLFDSGLLNELPHVRVRGLMGMATFTNDEVEIRRCFSLIRELAQRYCAPSAIVSIGMSEDFQLAIEEGSTEVRIGSDIFGPCH